MAEMALPQADREARTWAMFAHLSALIGLVVPLGNILAPLVVWLAKRHDSSFVDEQGVEALNFQISMTIYILAALLLVLVAIGVILAPAIAIVDIVLTIIAAARASRGEHYHYPLTIQFVPHRVPEAR